MITGPVKFSFKTGTIDRTAIAFWCAMIPSKLFDEIGILDEIFSPGMGEDGDFCIKSELVGYQIFQVPNDINHSFGTQPIQRDTYDNIPDQVFPIMHIGSATFGWMDCGGLIERNKQILDTRYGNSLEQAYDWCLNHPCDINEHFPTIRKYASECEHIIEFGTRGVFSTYALMAARPKKLLTYDIELNSNIWIADAIAKENGIQFGFMHCDTTNTEIESTDLLLIDTKHTYDQLSRELLLHAPKVKKYIILHDTETFAYHGEGEEEDSQYGLINAIDDYIQDSGQWELHKHFENNNGLTILKRKEVKQEIETFSQYKKYTVIIPTYNHCDDLLKPCIESIEKYSNMDNVRVIIVANGCTDNTKDYVTSLIDTNAQALWNARLKPDHVDQGAWNEYKRLRPQGCFDDIPWPEEWVRKQPFQLIWIDEAVGYTKATNQGIKLARELGTEYVILLNNDTVLLDQPKNKWIDMLEDPFIKKNSVGIVGPLQLHDDYADYDVLIFFCVMIKLEVFDKIGLLDEIFSPGGGEDIDLTIRAKQAGYLCEQIEATTFTGGTNIGTFPIWHKDNRTFREIPEYTNWIVKRNGLINCKRYNKNIKLNIGAGGIEHNGYLSVDLNDKRAHILMDVTKLDFDNDSVTEIIASHVFEHLNPYHVMDILKDWRRVLKPGGKLIMEMPDIEQLCKRFISATMGERYGILNAVYGSVNTTNEGLPSEITSPHLFGWWPDALWHHLTGAGFRHVMFGPEIWPHPESNLHVEAIK